MWPTLEYHETWVYENFDGYAVFFEMLKPGLRKITKPRIIQTQVWETEKPSKYHCDLKSVTRVSNPGLVLVLCIYCATLYAEQ